MLMEAAQVPRRFDVLYERMSIALCVRRRVRDRHEAEDVTAAQVFHHGSAESREF